MGTWIGKFYAGFPPVAIVSMPEVRVDSRHIRPLSREFGQYDQLAIDENADCPQSPFVAGPARDPDGARHGCAVRRLVDYAEWGQIGIPEQTCRDTGVATSWTHKGGKDYQQGPEKGMA